MSESSLKISSFTTNEQVPSSVYSLKMLGEQTIPISSLHSGGILEDADRAYALAELKAVIVFKTFEITAWSQAPASTVAFLDHMQHLFNLYEKYNAISVDAPLEELVDGLPLLWELEDSLQKQDLLLVDRDVRNPGAVPSRYATGPSLPRVDRALLVASVLPPRKTADGIAAEARFEESGSVLTIPERLGIRSLPDRISVEVSTAQNPQLPRALRANKELCFVCHHGGG